jgi:hypothetical protein
MTKRHHTPDLYVLDALANDIEDLENILRMLNSDTPLGWTKEWGRAFRRDEVVEALSRLVQKEWVRVLVHASDGKSLSELSVGTLPPGDYDDVYYSLTERGRLVHSNWNPSEVE